MTPCLKIWQIDSSSDKYCSVPYANVLIAVSHTDPVGMEEGTKMCLASGLERGTRQL